MFNHKPAVLLLFLLTLGVTPPPGLAPLPLPSPAPTATASRSPGLHVSEEAFSNFIDSASSGPGIAPLEAAGFISGSPLSPNTPYDTWSSVPLTPGIAGIAQTDVTGTYVGRRYDASAVLGLGVVTGNMQNALYWGENLLAPLNSHLGYTALPYAITFPTHAGTDDATASVIAPLFASFGSHDNAWLVRGGFFDLSQTDKFVFTQPQLTNVTPNIGLQTPESLGNGPATLDAWPSPEPGLPLHGVDFTAHQRIVSLELTSGALPALPGDRVQASIASIVFDHGEGTRYSFSYLHVATGGIPIVTTTLYGANPATLATGQGGSPLSTLSGQRETIAGTRAAFHVTRNVGGVLEIGRTWYDANEVVNPGSSLPGGFYHLGFSQNLGRTTLGIDGYRFEARYANAILPYGTAENVWSAAWSWPGVWLKSTYQLVDNVQAPGSNRQGVRIKYGLDRGPIEIHAAYGAFYQIDPATLENLEQTGFVDGFFLPQQDAAATLGSETQYNAWAAWHPHFGDVTLDYANDELHRDAVPGHPEDAVAYQTPQTVLTYIHAFSPFAVADVGFGRYAMKGTWAQTYTNVNYFENTVFIGTQFATSRRFSTLVQLRHAQFVGIPGTILGPAPDFGATTLIVEERLRSQ